MDEKPKRKKSIVKRWWFWVIIVIVVIIIIANLGGRGGNTATNQKPQTNTATEQSSPTNNATETSSPISTTEQNSATESPSVDQIAYEEVSSNITLWKNSIGTIWGGLAYEIKNTGSAPLYLSSKDFDIEDSNGKLIKVMKMVTAYPQIILPGENAVYYDATTLDNVTDANMTLSVVPHINPVVAKVEQYYYPISDVEIQNGSLGIQAIGRVENNTDKEEKLLRIAVICRDESNKVLTVMFTFVDVQAGEKAGFTVTALSLPEGVNADSVKSFQTYAYKDQIQF